MAVVVVVAGTWLHKHLPRWPKLGSSRIFQRVAKTRCLGWGWNFCGFCLLVLHIRIALFSWLGLRQRRAVANLVPVRRKAALVGRFGFRLRVVVCFGGLGRQLALRCTSGARSNSSPQVFGALPGIQEHPGFWVLGLTISANTQHEIS